MTANPIPSSIDLRPFCLEVRDQGQEGCCSGFSTAALREVSRSVKLGTTLQTPSLAPAYLYWRTRLAEGTFPADSGATIGDEISTLTDYGVCPEAALPYTQDPSEAGTPSADVAAQPFRSISASLVDHADPTFVKQVLAQNQAVVFGMPVYESFEDTGSDGIVAVPNTATEKLLGGHALLGVGFDDSTQRITVRNSWSASWGAAGYCFMPYSMVLGWMEAWTIPAQP